jgi:hypothetical protein
MSSPVPLPLPDAGENPGEPAPRLTLANGEAPAANVEPGDEPSPQPDIYAEEMESNPLRAVMIGMALLFVVLALGLALG